MKNKFKEWLEYVTNPQNTMSVIFDIMALSVAIMFITLAVTGGHS